MLTPAQTYAPLRPFPDRVVPPTAGVNPVAHQYELMVPRKTA